MPPSPAAHLRGAQVITPKNAHHRRQLVVVHAVVRGRVRVHVEGLAGEADAVEAFAHRLREHPAIRQASASAVTGNVLIFFDSATPLDELLRTLELALESLRGAIGGPARVRSASAEPNAEATTSVWTRDVADVFHTLATSQSGLTAADAGQRLTRVGPNSLISAAHRSPAAIMLAQFRGFPVFLLLGSAVLSLATGGMGDALVIATVVIANAAIGAWTEHHAERTIGALTRIEPPPVDTLRDGVATRVAIDRLVPGDVFQLTRGDSVPADARLIQVDDCTLDESALTGESMPVTKSTDALPDPDAPLAERRNMVFRGTTMTGGTAQAVVVATGAATEVGRVQSLMTTASRPRTPLEQQLDTLGRQLALATGIATSAVAFIGLLRRTPAVEILRSSLSLAVAAIPEGLPTVATTTLAAGMRRLRDRKVIVRTLDAIETFGAVQVIGLDKTGTITLNRMRVEAVAVDGTEQRRDASGRMQASTGAQTDSALRRLLQIGILCSEADVHPEGKSVAVEGSSTEAALLRFAEEAGVDVVVERERMTLIAQQTRTEERMYMATLHASPDGGRLVSVKGRADQVLELCDSVMVQGEVTPLTPELRKAIQSGEARLAEGGLRTLGFAYAEGGGQELGDLERMPRLVWTGLVGMADPPRPEIADVIGRLRRAGIRPVMITGDQSVTARAIAREVGLARDDDLEVLDSTDLEGIPPDRLSALADRVDVFSRVSPLNKVEVVKALQQAGLTVAMTGDGINDGPALRAADVGIALARDGTEVAREVADVLLLDDRLATLLDLVAEGRGVSDDIARSVHFIVATNLSEVLLTVIAAAAGFGTPLNPRQLLWINVLSDVFPELALALEPPADDVLERPARPRNTPLVTAADYRRLVFDSLVMTSASFTGFMLEQPRAGERSRVRAFLTITAAQLLYAFSARSEIVSILEGRRLPPNPYLNEAVGGGFIIQALASSVASVRQLLGNRRMTAVDIGVSWGLAAVSFAVTETIKLWRHQRAQETN